MEIKKSYLNAFDKASKTAYFEDFREDVGHRRYRNPFSGVWVELDPLESTIYNFCVEWYARYESGDETETPVSVYDNMRYYLLALNSKAYMDLLD